MITLTLTTKELTMVVDSLDLVDESIYKYSNITPKELSNLAIKLENILTGESVKEKEVK